ncbi:MAG: hypothetical protein Q8L79_07635 [Methylobacter sp.]|uniref:hypothetical protein n=1 Tax=Methylobacter sp. TaxID=2051955 RepID=UPI002730ADF9|nr:hypothetical protein [Methylobacter sp.]MDP1664984.1 hypothetical protein [Methylobacter sp.]
MNLFLAAVTAASCYDLPSDQRACCQALEHRQVSFCYSIQNNDLRDDGAAELRHNDFMAKVLKVLGEEVARKFSHYYIATNGKKNPCYNLPKREAQLMVMSENYKVQADVLRAERF